MDMLRVTAHWTGFSGAPGYSNFFFAGGGGLISDAQQVADRVSGAFAGLTSHLPRDVTVRVLPEVAVIDSDTGMATDIRIIEPLAAAVGASSGNYSAPTGAVINWRTADMRNGRRIRGRTFLVPLGSTSFFTDGTLSIAGLAAVNTFGDAMRGGDLDSELGVWSRPQNGSGGVFATVTGHTVPDMAAVLRSRRD